MQRKWWTLIAVSVATFMLLLRYIGPSSDAEGLADTVSDRVPPGPAAEES